MKRTKIQGEGLLDLGIVLQDLKILGLSDSETTDIGLREFAKASPNLQEIYLGRTNITHLGINFAAKICSELSTVCLTLNWKDSNQLKKFHPRINFHNNL